LIFFAEIISWNEKNQQKIVLSKEEATWAALGNLYLFSNLATDSPKKESIKILVVSLTIVPQIVILQPV
jgi:hypothetical protein